MVTGVQEGDPRSQGRGGGHVFGGGTRNQGRKHFTSLVTNGTSPTNDFTRYHGSCCVTRLPSGSYGERRKRRVPLRMDPVTSRGSVVGRNRGWSFES